MVEEGKVVITILPKEDPKPLLGGKGARSGGGITSVDTRWRGSGRGSGGGQPPEFQSGEPDETERMGLFLDAWTTAPSPENMEWLKTTYGGAIAVEEIPSEELFILRRGSREEDWFNGQRNKLQRALEKPKEMLYRHLRSILNSVLEDILQASLLSGEAAETFIPLSHFGIDLAKGAKYGLFGDHLLPADRDKIEHNLIEWHGQIAMGNMPKPEAYPLNVAQKFNERFQAR